MERNYEPHYPRVIYKNGEMKSVKTPFEHAEWIEKGWSGPAIFGQDMEWLEEEVERLTVELKQAEKKLMAAKKAAGVEEKEKEEPQEPENGEQTNILGLEEVDETPDTAAINNPGSPTCTICGKTFKTEAGLTGHMTSHAVKGR